MRVSVYNRMHRQLMPIIRQCLISEEEYNSKRRGCIYTRILGQKAGKDYYFDFVKALILQEDLKEILKFIPRDNLLINGEGVKLESLLPDGNYDEKKHNQHCATVDAFGGLIIASGLRMGGRVRKRWRIWNFAESTNKNKL